MREAFARMCRRDRTGKTRPGSISMPAPPMPPSRYVRTEVLLGWGYPAPLVISRAVSHFDLERHAVARIEPAASEPGKPEPATPEPATPEPGTRCSHG